MVRFLSYLLAAIVLLIAGFIIVFVWFQPPFYFPNPTGPYAVGMRDYHLTDIARKEIFGNDPAHSYRELMVKIWYPAVGQVPVKPSTPYVPYLVEYLKKKQKTFWLRHWFYRPVYSYAKCNAHVAPHGPRYPIILFSHGSEMTADHYTAYCENLASHGYVVVGINHTYNSRVVQFPDGRIVDGAKSMATRHKDKNLTQVLEQFDQDVEIWIADVSFVLDKLEQLAQDKKSIFYQRFDQQNIGIFGHSVGGGTAAQICYRDPRVKTGVALDGFFLAQDPIKAFNKPFMFMLAGDRAQTFERSWTPDDCKKFGIGSSTDEKRFRSYYLPVIEGLAKPIGHDVYTFVMAGAGHLDFSDTVFLRDASPAWRTLVRSGMADGAFGAESINGLRATEIVNAYLVSFFDKYLKDQPSELLDGGSETYPDVAVKKW